MRIPDGWKKVKLKDITESINGGGTPRRDVKEYWDNGDIPWLKISDLKFIYISESEEKITQKGLENSSAKLFSKGTVLFSIFATLGAVGILEKSATTNQAIAGIIPKKEIIDTKYLYYSLKAEKNNIVAKKTHATQDNINLTILRNHEVLLPPLEVQKKIVTILEKAEQLKQWRQESDKLTDEYLNSVFLEMFGDVYKNPFSFEEKNLGELAEFAMGGTPDPRHQEYYSGGIGWVKGGDIDKEFIYEAENRISELGLKNSRAQIYEKDTVLIGRTGQGKTRGKTAILRMESSTNETVIGIKPNRKLLTSEYLHYNLKFRYKELRDIGGDAKRGGITQRDLNRLKIIVPPIELQNKFSTVVTRFEKMKRYHKLSRQQIDDLFNTLMQKAFRGELIC